MQILMVVAQSALFAWKKRHQRSYDMVRPPHCEALVLCVLRRCTCAAHPPCLTGVAAGLLQVTLAGLWLIPPIISEQMHFYTFLVVWAVYSAVTGYLMYVCMSKKADHTTPRKVGASILPSAALHQPSTPSLAHCGWLQP